MGDGSLLVGHLLIEPAGDAPLLVSEPVEGAVLRKGVRTQILLSYLNHEKLLMYLF